MLGTIVQAGVRAVLGTLVDYLQGLRRDQALRDQGKYESLKERYDVERVLMAQARSVRDRIRSDPALRQRLLDELRDNRG